MAGKRSPTSTYSRRSKLVSIPQPKDKKPRDDEAQALFSEFGHRLQVAMDAKNWSQSELSRRCEAIMPKPAKGQVQNRNFGRDRVSHYVRGVSMPRPEALAVLAKALGVEQDELLPPGVPTGGGSRPSWRMESVGGGRVFLSINRTLDYDLALEVSALARSRDNLPPLKTKK